MIRIIFPSVLAVVVIVLCIYLGLFKKTKED